MRQTKKNHLDDYPLPEGFRIFEEHLVITDIDKHRAAAENFCRSLDRRLTLAPGTGNTEPDSIGIVGTSRGWTGLKEELLGYVPKACARRLLVTPLLLAVVVPRLSTTCIDENGYVIIEFQIIGPNESYDRYQHDRDDRQSVNLNEQKVDDEQILDVLADAITETEDTSWAHNLPVSPWPYIVMAKMFRKLGMLDEERTVLERYDAQRKPIGKSARLLEERLREVRRRAMR